MPVLKKIPTECPNCDVVQFNKRCKEQQHFNPPL